MKEKEGIVGEALVHKEEGDGAASFLLLLSKKRFDKALTVQGVPDEVFERPEVREAGRDAMILALNIGEPEDAWRMKEAFRLGDDVLDDEAVSAALKRKLEHYKRAGWQEGVRRLKERYGLQYS